MFLNANMSRRGSRRFLVGLLTLFMMQVMVPSLLWSAIRTWDHDAGDDLWSTAVNWSGDVSPVPGDEVVFDGGVTNLNCAINTSVTIFSIITQNGYSGTITQEQNVSITGTVGLSLNSGRFTTTTTYPHLTLAGDLFVGSGATLDHDAAYWTSINFTKNGTQMIAGGGKITLGGSFSGTISIGALATVKLADNVTVVIKDSNLTVNNGLIGGTGSKLQMYLTSGDARTVDNNSAVVITLWDFEVRASAAATGSSLQLLGAGPGFTVLGTVMITNDAGNLAPQLILASGQTLTVADMTFSGGELNANAASKIVYKSTVNSSIAGGTPGTGGSITFGTLLLDSPGVTLSTGNSFSASRLTINAGVLSIEGSDSVTIKGDDLHVNSAATLTGGASSVLVFQALTGNVEMTGNNAGGFVSIGKLSLVEGPAVADSLFMTLVGVWDLKSGLHFGQNSTAGITLFAGTSSITLGSGGISVEQVSETTIKTESSTFTYANSAASVLGGLAYNNLVVDGSGNFSISGGSITLGGTFTAKNGAILYNDGATTNIVLSGNATLETSSGIHLEAGAGALIITATASPTVSGNGFIKVKDLQIRGSSGSVAVLTDLTLNPNVLTIDSGTTFSLGSNTLVGVGIPTWTKNGIFDPASSLVRFTHAGAVTFNLPINGPWYDLAVAGVAGIIFMFPSGETVVRHDLNSEQTAKITLGDNDSLVVGHSMTLADAFTTGAGSTVVMTGDGAVIEATGVTPIFQTLLLTGSSGAQTNIAFSTHAMIQNSLYVDVLNGGVDFGGNTITLEGGIVFNSPTTITTASSNFVFMQTLAVTIPGDRQYSDIDVAASGTTLRLTGVTTVSNFRLKQGTVYSPTGTTLVVSGSSCSVASSAVLTLDGDLAFTGSSVSFEVHGGGEATVQDLMNSGGVNLTGTGLSVRGDIINSGTLTSTLGGARLTLTGTSSTLNLTGATNQLNDVVISAGTATLNGTLQVDNTLVVNSGTTFALGSQAVVTLAGSGTPLLNSGTVNATAGTIVYAHSTSAAVTLATTGVQYGFLMIDGATTFSTPADLSVGTGLGVLAGTLSVGSNNVTVVGPVFLSAAGNFAQQNGTTTLSGAGELAIDGLFTAGSLHIAGNYTLSGSGIAQVGTSLVVDSSGTLNLGTGTVKLTGSGTPLYANGLLEVSLSTIIYSSSTGATVVPLTYANLVIDSTSSFQAGGNLICLADMTISGADFDLQTHTLTVGGHLDVSSSFSTSAGSAVNLTGSNHVLNAGTGGFTVQSMFIPGNYTLSGTITIEGEKTPLVVNGTVNGGTSTVIYISTSGATLAGISYNNLQVNRSGRTFTAGGNFSALNISVTGGTTLELGTVRVSLAGPLNNEGNILASATSTLVATGGGDLGSSTGSTVLGNLLVDGTSAYQTFGTDFAILESLLVFPSRTLNLGAISLVVGGDIVNNGDISQAQNAFVALTGGTSTSARSLGNTLATSTQLAQVIIVGNYFLDGNIMVQDLTIESGGVLSKGSFTITFGTGGQSNQNTFGVTTQHANSEISEVPFLVTLLAKDLNNNTIVGYAGGHRLTLTSSSTSSTASVTLPPTAIFTFSNGLLTITMTVVGDTTVTLRVTDDVGMGGVVTISVNPGAVVDPGTGGTVTAADGTKVDIPPTALPVTLTNAVVSVVTFTTTDILTLLVKKGGFEIVVTTPLTVREIIIRDLTTNETKDVTFSIGVTIEIPYSDTDVPAGIREENLRVFRYDSTNQRWTLVEGTQTVDTTNNIVKVVGVLTFSIFGVLPISVQADFATVRVYPMPYKPASAFEGTLKFTNMPLGTTVRIFTVDGHLVRTLDTTSFSDIGNVTWDGTNESGEDVVSGVYFYVLTADNVGTKRGKLVVLR